MHCPACASSASFLLDATDHNRDFPGNFPYYRCDACRLVFIAEVPQDMGPFYAGGYQKIPTSAEQLGLMAESETYRLDSILPYRQSGRLLEIGPWIGLFSSVAMKRGFEVTAIEINQQCVDFLREQLKIRAIRSVDPVETLQSMPDRFDVIVLWHSVEHLPRPWEVIGEAANHLAPGGILLVAAPNPESAQFRILGKRWYHLDAPRHLYLLPPEMVTNIGRNHGLETLSITTSDRLSRILDRIAWHNYVGRLLPIPGARWLLRRIVTPILSAWSGEQRKGAGSGYTAIMRRPATD